MLNSYAVIFQTTAALPAGQTPDLVVYYGIERGSNNGAGDVGFWLLQDKTVACDGTNGTTTFTGHHSDGDVLVVSEFTTGGTISTIKVFVWQGTANPSNPLVLKADISSPEPNCTNPAPPASAVACGITNTKANQPNGAGATDDGLISTPWLTQPANNTLPKPLPSPFAAGHTLADNEFYEGAINITSVIGGGNSTPCFAKFVPDTRSSPSTTATLFDFAVASFASCPTHIVTTPSSTSTLIPATLNDSATLTGGIEPIGGTITFKLYGPNDPTCTGTVLYTQTVNVNGAGTYSTSPGQLVTTAGTYQWVASYSGDASGNQPSSGACGDEAVVLGVPTPTVDSAQNLRPNDSATVNGVSGLPTPTGTVDFKLFATADCSGTPVFQQLTVALSSGSASTSNGTLPTGNFTVVDANEGTYKWTVHYSGDSNYASADKACGAEQFTASITN